MINISDILRQQKQTIKKGFFTMTKIELLNDFKRFIKSQEEIGTRRIHLLISDNN